MSKPHRIAILDDSQDIALAAADWAQLSAHADITVFKAPFASEDEAAETLRKFDILVLMRERTAFPASLINRLPALRMIALTGARAPSLDLAACAARGIVVSNTPGDKVTPATAELAWALALACARDLGAADSGMRHGRFHEGLRMGIALEGKRMGIVGLGRLGSRVAGYARAFGMEVVAWSQNLTAEKATEGGAALVSKHELFATCDVISLHLVLSDRTRGVVGPTEIAAMKPGAIIVNTSRGPLIDSAALAGRLIKGDIVAGLDVYDVEPPAAADQIRTLRNTVLSPHLGYSTGAVFEQFYRHCVENIAAFIAGQPIRVISAD
jgi:phosphoglycerate dehydrogenase-like enzyme